MINGVRGYEDALNELALDFMKLYEKVKKDSPDLYWEGEGIIEYYLMMQLVADPALHKGR